jgi:hypothetical protein
MTEEKPVEEKKRSVTPESFIVEAPLYTKVVIAEGFQPPSRISYDCDTPVTCGKETTWAMLAERVYQDAGSGHGAFYILHYGCTRCGKSFLSVMYREVASELRKSTPPRASSAIIRSVPAPAHRVVTTVEKIGQYPPLSIRVPKPLQKNLGELHTALYK